MTVTMNQQNHESFDKEVWYLVNRVIYSYLKL